MTIKQYTNVSFYRNELRVRGLDENGQRVNEIVDFCPTLWVRPSFNYRRWRSLIESVDINTFKDIDGKQMVAVKFKSIKDCEKFIKDNLDRTNRLSKDIWDAPRNRYESQYLCENFPLDTHCDVYNMKVYIYDIETEVGHRNVPDDTKVKIRQKASSDNDITDNELEGLTTETSIASFETLPEQSKYELYDESKKIWVDYEKHPYRFIGGFPEPDKATEKITLITVKDINDKKVYTWGMDDFKTDRTDLVYTKCANEKELLSSFLKWFSSDYPDILSGYNSASFDNLYLATRISKVLGEEKSKMLSPYGQIKRLERKDPKTHSPVKECEYEGIACLDYLKLYKKWGTASQRESYRLDSVGEDEVGQKKVQNPTGGTFRDFYTGVFDVKTEPNEDDHEIKKLGYERTKMKYVLSEHPELLEKYNKLNDLIIAKCKQLFIEYNIQDVELVEKIEKKLRLLDVITTTAYKAHENFIEAFGTVKTWDYILYNHFNAIGVVIPHESTSNNKDEKYEGAYCKPPLVGKHEFCESFDLDSLYPHLIMQYNISPDTVVKDSYGENVKIHYNIDKLVAGTEDTSFAKSNNYSVSASGVCFRRDKQGMIPHLCETYYRDRKSHKKEYLRIKAEHEKIVEELRKRGVAFESE